MDAQRLLMVIDGASVIWIEVYAMMIGDLNDLLGRTAG